MSSHDDLGRTLRDRADSIGAGEHPLSLDDVKGRARGIRRRRVAVTGLAAAAVLAVAVPAGVLVADRATTQREVPPVNSPSPDATSTPSPTEDGDVKVVTLDNNIDAHSGKPGIDYLLNGDVMSRRDGSFTIQFPNGQRPPHQYVALTPTDEAWLALWSDDRGGMSIDFVKRGGIVFDTRRSTDSMAVSQDGSIAVYSTPDGELRSFSIFDEHLGVNDPAQAPPDVEPVAVTGSRTCKEQEPEGGGCTVFYNDRGVDPAGYYASSHGIQERLEDVVRVTGVSPDGRISGLVSVTDTGSCSQVWTQDLTPEWKTCDYALGQFSPDGRYVLGHPAYGDGIGDSSVAILDAATGRVLVDYRNDRQAQAYINNAVWDVDGTVLATVFARGSWSLMRMSPGGLLSLVDGLEALGTDGDSPPLVLPTRP